MKNYPILISAQQVEQRIVEIAEAINAQFKGTSPVFVCVLKGAFLFFSELVKRVELDCEIDFMTISSYEGQQSKEIKYIDKDFSHLEGRNIILVDDILDTGKTLHFLFAYLQQFKPKEISLVTLLKREGKNPYNIIPLHFGFEIGNEFVVGYGLDHDQKFRNLPYISKM